jgi:hypothetical protein
MPQEEAAGVAEFNLFVQCDLLRRATIRHSLPGPKFHYLAGFNDARQVFEKKEGDKYSR